MSPSGMNGGRLMGIDRYQDVPGRNWKRFFLSGLMTIPGCLPLTLGVTYAILSSSILVLLPAALIGGGVAGPFIACLYDTVLRALRDAPAAGAPTTARPWLRTGAPLCCSWPGGCWWCCLPPGLCCCSPLWGVGLTFLPLCFCCTTGWTRPWALKRASPGLFPTRSPVMTAEGGNRYV